MPAPVSSLIRVVDTARHHHHDDTGAFWGGADLPVAVWEVLDAVPDPRRMRGRRHALATVLAVALVAVLAGARSP